MLDGYAFDTYKRLPSGLKDNVSGAALSGIDAITVFVIVLITATDLSL